MGWVWGISDLGLVLQSILCKCWQWWKIQGNPLQFLWVVGRIYPRRRHSWWLLVPKVRYLCPWICGKYCPVNTQFIFNLYVVWISFLLLERLPVLKWWKGNWYQKKPMFHLELPFVLLSDSGNSLLSVDLVYMQGHTHLTIPSSRFSRAVCMAN